MEGHSEDITMDVAPIGLHQIILGLPWLQCHNLDINWERPKIMFGSTYCNNHCLAQLANIMLKQDTIDMDEDTTKIYAIDFLPTATEDT